MNERVPCPSCQLTEPVEVFQRGMTSAYHCTRCHMVFRWCTEEGTPESAKGEQADIWPNAVLDQTYDPDFAMIRVMQGCECDWGACDRAAVGVRLDRTQPTGCNAWLPVCAEHLPYVYGVST